MNFNHYYTCNCGFEKSFNEGKDFFVIQCGFCYHLESKEEKKQYKICCNGCGYVEKIGSNFSFSGEYVCKGCELKGNIDFIGGKKELFSLKEDEETMEPCPKCKKTNWTDGDNGLGFKCPRCRGNLKQKMSSLWE